MTTNSNAYTESKNIELKNLIAMQDEMKLQRTYEPLFKRSVRVC